MAPSLAPTSSRFGRLAVEDGIIGFKTSAGLCEALSIETDNKTDNANFSLSILPERQSTLELSLPTPVTKCSPSVCSHLV